MMDNDHVEILHIYIDENKLADFFTNHGFSFIGTNEKEFHNLQEVPQNSKAILLVEKNKCPNLSIRKFQNRAKIMEMKTRNKELQ